MVGHIPGYRAWFGSLSLSGVLLPTTWWNPGFYSSIRLGREKINVRLIFISSMATSRLPGSSFYHRIYYQPTESFLLLVYKQFRNDTMQETRDAQDCLEHTRRIDGCNRAMSIAATETEFVKRENKAVGVE